MFWSRKIASNREQKGFLVFATTLTVFFGFQAVAFSAAIYQLGTFLNLSLLIYFFLIGIVMFVFDIKFKIPSSWSRSAYYYQHNKHRLKKVLSIIWRALRLRFLYIRSWHNWLYFQNYLILPTVLYWGAVLLIFLNPFDSLRKQIFIICATLMLAIVFWFFKTLFQSFNSTALEARYLMFSVMVLSAFMIFAPSLGLVWYLGLPPSVFVLAIACFAFLLLYQSLFHHSRLDLASNIKYAFFGALFLALAAFVVTKFWSVNYFSAGTLLAGCLFWYWSLVLQWLQGRLTLKRAAEYTGLFLLIVLFVLATTNFHARIG